MRQAIRGQTKIVLSYRDEGEQETSRTIWPVAVGYYETVRIIAAWCELRQDFRHFRTDRVSQAEFLEERYPGRKAVLRSQWQKSRMRTDEETRQAVTSRWARA